MQNYSRTHLADSNLRLSLHTRAAQDRIGSAELLADIAEFDHRELFLPAAYDSMSAYCVGELKMSEDVAHRRINVARLALQYPMIFEAIADGRLNLTAVLTLSRHLKDEKAEELLAAAANKSKSQIEQLLAERFPRPAAPSRIEAVLPVATGQTNPEPALARVRELSGPSRVAPIAPQLYDVRLSIDDETHEDLDCVRALLSHQLPSGDVAKIFALALKSFRRDLEKRKFGATGKPRASRGSGSPRYIPAEVRRAVRERDGDRCSFVSPEGRRCGSRKFLEFDHAIPVAQGGSSTVSNVRLLCRRHNQYAADCTFGAPFMESKRQEAIETNAAARQRAEEERTANEQAAVQARDEAEARAVEEARARAAAEEARAATQAREKETTEIVIAALRRLGYRTENARDAAKYAMDAGPDLSLEARVKKALTWFAPRGTFIARVAPDGRPAAASTSRVSAGASS